MSRSHLLVKGGARGRDSASESGWELFAYTLFDLREQQEGLVSKNDYQGRWAKAKLNGLDRLLLCRSAQPTTPKAEDRGEKAVDD
ncbi:hypothetical protein VNO80_03064 [Phaseolus coccineus]|uniref:Uncharacterized protein n=1 Tax=Phaseolus coccineus TaxID=3886 RepID=A0AAN9NSH5_PHACN